MDMVREWWETLSSNKIMTQKEKRNYVNHENQQETRKRRKIRNYRGDTEHKYQTLQEKSSCPAGMAH